MPEFSPTILERFRTRKFAGVLPTAGRVARATTPASDAVLEFSLMLDDGRVTDLRFRALGCVTTIATADWLCEYARGRSEAELLNLEAREVVAALALPAERRHCAVLVCDALRAALQATEPESASAVRSKEPQSVEVIE